MEPEQLIESINALLDTALKRWDKAAPSIEQDLYERILELSGQFETVRGGFRASTANLKLLRQIKKELKDLLSQTDYSSQYTSLLGEFDSSAEFMARYFSTFVKNFQSTSAVLSLVKQTSIAATRNSLTGAGLNVALLDPIEKILRDNITTGGKLSDFKKQLKAFIVGNPNVPSKLQSYVGQITTDALNQFNRNYMLTVTNELGLQFMLYEGIKKENSRPFCKERAGKFYHREEIEDWASLNWAGKIPGTSATTIFIYCGGYKCRHFTIPVAVEAVPKDVVQRAIEKGFYKVAE